MKNYHDVTNDLLARRDQYVREQKQKKRRIVNTVTSLCCVCLVMLMGIGVWQWNQGAPIPPTDPNNSMFHTGMEGPMFSEPDPTTVMTDPKPTTNTGAANNDQTDKFLFAVNEINGTLNAAMKYLDPELHYEEIRSLDQVAEYLGINVLSAVATLPEGLGMEYTGSGEFKWIYENNGTLAEDRMCFEFNGNDEAKITVLASKLRSPYDCLYQSDTDAVTQIRIPETDEIIPVLVYGQNKSDSTLDYDFYVLDFEYGGVYYRILAENVRSYNLDSLIRELVK